MQLFYTRRSPFARKAILILKEKGLDSKVKLVEVDLKQKPEALIAANPLGKIPALVLEDGSSLVDSPVICEYVDSLDNATRMIPKSGPKRWKAKHIEALADGMCEAAIAIFYQRDGGSPDEAVIKKNMDALNRTLTLLEEAAYLKPIKSKRLSLAPIAVASALGYIDFRIPDLGWQKRNKKLARWYKAFSDSTSSTRPLNSAAISRWSRNSKTASPPKRCSVKPSISCARKCGKRKKPLRKMTCLNWWMALAMSPSSR
jgi:glutathione S-transferase